MSEPVTNEIGKIDLPYQRKVSVRTAEFDSGMTMLRLVFREGMRITQIDLDAEATGNLVELLNNGREKLSK